MSIGKIEIDILANTTKLVQGMTRAEKSVGQAVKNITAGLGAIVAVFSAGIVINRINQTNEALDKIGKTSAKLGITAEALQAMHLAASEAGISTDTFNMAVQRMVRRVAEAAKGTGEAVGALNELNLSAGELMKLTPDEMLKRVADSMGGVAGQGDKVRLAMKLFDSEGVSMVNMLKNGSQGLDDVARKAERFGLIVGSKYISAIEDSNDKLNIFNEINKSVWKGISVGTTDAVITFFNALSKGNKKLDIFNVSLDLTKQVIYVAGRAFEILSSTIKTAVAGYMNLYTMGKLIKAEMTGTPEEISEAWTLHNAAIDDSKKKLAEMVKAYAGTSDTAKALRAILERIYEPLNNEDLSDSIKNTNDNISSQSTLWSETELAAAKYYNSLSNNTTKATKVVSALNSTISNGISNAFRQAMDGAVSFGETFKTIIKDIIAELIRLLVVQQAVAAAMRGITGGGAIATGGGAAAVGAAPAATATPAVGSSVMFASAPNPQALSGATAIRSAGARPQSESSGVNINVINNANTNVDIDDRGDTIDIFISAVNDSIARGGSVAETLETRYPLTKA